MTEAVVKLEADGRRPRVEETRLVHIDHVQQRFTWDCGLACIAMVLLPRQREEFLANLRKIAVEEGFHESTWTIDLAYLLKRFDVPHRYRTITLGIDPSFADEHFYNRLLHKDRERVMSRFREAPGNGLRVEKGSVDLREIIEHVDSRGPVIVLTDGVMLFCLNCGHNMSRFRASRILPFRSGFEGHYVVVVGYHLRRGSIYYRNPALKDRVCIMPFSGFEKARKAHGTDEDVLFVYFKNDPGSGHAGENRLVEDQPVTSGRGAPRENHS